MTAFETGIDVRCIGCGRECPFPAKASAERTLSSADAAEFYCDMREACAQCGSKRICVRVHVGFGGEGE